MAGKRLYVAYGSNINLDQMSRRCPDAEVVDMVTIANHELLFRGCAGSGLATIRPKAGCVVHGLLWNLTPRCEKALDRYEGYPTLYGKRDVMVRDSRGRIFSVMAYVMQPELELQPAEPSDFYYQGIREGYCQNGLPVQALDNALRHVRREAMGTPANPERTGVIWTTLYFAYGSNLNLDQMAQRCPDAEPLGNAVLNDHTLVFRGRRDGSGVATIIPCYGRKVQGVLWSLTDRCEASLDRCEGVPDVYDKQTVRVKDMDGNDLKVMTYTMTDVKNRDPAMPSEAYYQRIREGYRQNGIPLRSLGLALQRAREETAKQQGETTVSDKTVKKGKKHHER